MEAQSEMKWIHVVACGNQYLGDAVREKAEELGLKLRWLGPAEPQEGEVEVGTATAHPHSGPKYRLFAQVEAL